jgi:protein O-mannosyl-transferase
MNVDPRYKTPLVVLGLAMLVAAGYTNSFKSEFIFDNQFIIKNDTRIQKPSMENVKLVFTEDYWYPRGVGALYRPITTLSFMTDYSVWGFKEDHRGYHWANVGLHLLNAVLLYFLLKTLLGSVWPATMGAALFAVHPIGTESVTNLVGRSDLLAAASVMGGLLIYMRAIRASGWRRWLWMVLLMVTTTLGVLSKENALVIVAILPLYDFAFRYRRQHQKIGREAMRATKEYFLNGYIVFVPIVIGFFWWRSHMYSLHGPSPESFQDNLLRGASFLAARVTAIKVIGSYLWLLVFPISLSSDYSFNQVPVFTGQMNSLEEWKTPLAVLAVAGILWFAFRTFRRGSKRWFFFIGFFFLALLPTSNLIILIDSNMAERFLYLPMIGFIGCVAMAADLLPRVRLAHWRQVGTLRVGHLVILMIVLVFTVRTYLRNEDWENSATLWDATARSSPNSARVHRLRAWAIYSRDTDHPALDDAIAAAERSAEILKGLAPEKDALLTHLYLGMFYGMKGDRLATPQDNGSLVSNNASAPWFARSLASLERARAIDQANNEKQKNQGLARGRTELQIHDAGMGQVYENLGVTLSRLGRHTEAIDAYKYLLRLDPSNQDGYNNLAVEYVLMDNDRDAAEALLQCVLVGDTKGQAARSLARIYAFRNPTPQIPAFTSSDGGRTIRINMGCPIVRADASSAAMKLAEAFLRLERKNAAESVRSTMRRLEFDMTPYDELWRKYGLEPPRTP